MDINMYKPQPQEIKTIKDKLKTGDKVRIRLALLKKHLLPNNFKIMKNAIYFLLSCMKNSNIDFSVKPSGSKKTYLQLILECIDKYRNPLSKLDNIKECIELAFKKSIGEYSTTYSSDDKPDFKNLKEFISGNLDKEDGKGTVVTLADKKTKNKRRLSLSFGSMGKSVSKNNGTKPRSSSSSAATLKQIANLGVSAIKNVTRSRSLSTSKLPSTGVGDKSVARPRRNSVSIGSLARSNDKEKFISLVKDNKEDLAEFYDLHKDDEYPGFTDSFMDLKAFLNGNVRGAKKLEFGSFLKKYGKNLKEDDIKKGTELLKRAMEYREKTLKLIEKLDNDKEILNKKFQKIEELYKTQSECTLFKKLRVSCTNYRDECSEHLPENVTADFNKRFDYQKLRNDFPQDIVKVYGTVSDLYHGNLFKDYHSGKTYAKLAINQEYGEVNDKLFDEHIKMFKKCQEKAIKALNDMHDEAYKLCNQEYSQESPASLFIPDPPIDEVNKLFDEIVKKLSMVKDNWNKL